MKQILLNEHGISPNTDITLALRELFSKHTKNTTFVFENADYYFNPHTEMQMDYRISNSNVKPYRVLGILMKDMENCVLQGNGARLWFEGQMQPITLDTCKHVQIKNFVIDWKKPLTSEGIILAHTENHADVYIDSAKFPHRLRDGRLEFDVGADEWYPLVPNSSHIIFESHTRTVRRNTGDRFRINGIEEIDKDVYRMTLKNAVEIADGDIVVLRHNERMHAGIFSEKCTDLTFEDIVFHSCGGLGCLAQFCHDLTYRRVHFIPNTAAGRRVISGRDDGMHITCNSGTVTITECTFIGLMDDPINVHGCCVTSDETAGDSALRCRYRHVQAQGFLYWAEPGDEIAFIDRGNMSCIGKATVRSYTLEKSDTFLLEFESPLPEQILAMADSGNALALDNLTHTASFVCTKNRFGSCRARGVLISTPKPILIENNYFESSGSAILVAGDSNQWFESGECHDVLIQNNTFTDHCLTSKYQFCDGVISISPVVPKPQTDKPYHKRIRIVNNTFDVTDTPLLYAYSTEDLSFTNNRIFKSPSSEKWHPADSRINLRYCNNAVLKDNEWIGKFANIQMLKTEQCGEVVSDL